jgi:hypothetical protein
MIIIICGFSSIKSRGFKSCADIDKFELSGFDNRNLLFNSTDFEAREDHTYSVEVTARRTDTNGTTTKTTTKTITVTVTDIVEFFYSSNFDNKVFIRTMGAITRVTDIVDDVAPTNMQITNVNLTAGHPAIAPIGILSADDKDTEASKLIFTTDSIGFTIVKGEKGYKLMTTKTIADGTVVTVTASDGTHSTDKDFVIKVRAVEESLTINMKDNFFTPKNKNREITLVVNQAGVSFIYCILDGYSKDFFNCLLVIALALGGSDLNTITVLTIIVVIIFGGFKNKFSGNGRGGSIQGEFTIWVIDNKKTYPSLVDNKRNLSIFIFWRKKIIPYF